MKFGEGFFRKTPEKKQEKILPESVRYALAHSEAKLSKELVEVLNNNHFTQEASYLITKILEINERERFEYLSTLIEIYTQQNDQSTTQKLNQQFLENIQPTIEVEGMKLGQISRQGFEYWQEKYKETGKELAEKHEDVFLLANSTIIGLEEITKAFYSKEKSFGIIFPKNVTGGNTVVGYEYTFANGKYTPGFIDRNKEHFKESIVLDDVENTGETRKLIENSWAETLGGAVSYKTISKTGKEA